MSLARIAYWLLIACRIMPQLRSSPTRRLTLAALALSSLLLAQNPPLPNPLNPPPQKVQAVTDTYNDIDDQYAVALAVLSPDSMELDPANYPWSKVIWDISAVAWVINPKWLPSTLVPSPYLTDDLHWKQLPNRHQIRVITDLQRDAIFHDLYEKLARSGN